MRGPLPRRAAARRVTPDGPMHRVSLSLVIHNHQPVGNFDEVFSKATDTAYEPMIAALERHPKIRLALHYTGPLLDWLRENRPALLRRVRSLVKPRPGGDPDGGILRAGAPDHPRRRQARSDREAHARRQRRVRRGGRGSLARGARVGAAAGEVDRRNRRALRDRRRHPLPGRRARGPSAVRLLPHRGAGRAAGRVPEPAETPLPDSLGRPRRGHRVPALARGRGRPGGGPHRAAGPRADGRRRREVRAVADDVRPVLGARLGGALLRRAGRGAVARFGAAR